MTLVHVLAIVLVVCSPLGNLLVMLLRGSSPRAAAFVAQMTPLLMFGVKLAEDVVEAPPEKRAKVALDDLAALATGKPDGEATVLVSRLRALFGLGVSSALMLAFLVWPLAGCSAVPQLATTLHAVQLSNSAIVVAAPCLVKAYELDEKACLDDPDTTKARECVATVRARWKPVAEGFTELRNVRCDIEPAKCVDGGAK